MLNLKLSTSSIVKLPVELPEGDFTLLVRRPSKGDLVQNEHLIGRNQLGKMIEYRQSLIMDWEGLNDDKGEPIPFNEKNRDAVLAVPDVYHAVNLAMFKLFNPPARDPEKNSEPTQG